MAISPLDEPESDVSVVVMSLVVVSEPVMEPTFDTLPGSPVAPAPAAAPPPVVVVVVVVPAAMLEPELMGA